MTNTPGQSGDPRSPFYQNLFKDWAKDRYFPAYFSDKKIKKHTNELLIFRPKSKQ
jgi:penicillin amidase